MVLKKLEFIDYHKTVTIRTDEDIDMTNPRINEFLKLLAQFEGVVKSGMKILEMINGPPVYDYYMKSADDREFTETVTVDGHPIGEVLFTFNVPDPWSQSEVDAYFLIRRLTTEMFLDHFISDVVVKWK